MTGILEDVGQAIRSLRRTPVLSAVIVLTLGLGIGMNAAIFSVVSGVLLRPLEYRDPERLVHVRGRLVADDIDNAQFPGGVLSQLRRDASHLEDLAGVAAIRQNLTGTELPVQVQVGWTSTNLFRVLGVMPALGRDFREDEPPGSLMLSHAFWKDQFGGRADVLEQVVALDGHAYSIVGVLPPGFRVELPRIPTNVDVWKVPDDWWQNGDIWSAESLEFGLLSLVGRLDAQASLGEAQAQMDTLAARLRENDAQFAQGGMAIALDPLHAAVVADVGATLWLLLGAVACVLLIACANVMNIMLARGQARERETAVRVALGATRFRLVRSMLFEALALALVGGGFGLLLAGYGIDALQALRPPDLPRADAIGLDLRVLGFTLAACVGCTLLFGLVPALGATRRGTSAQLHQGRTTLDPRRVRAGGVLVAAQIALSLVLLVGGGLLATSLARLHDVPPGFDADRLLTFSVSLPGTNYERPLGTDRFLRGLEEAARSLPGVQSAGVVWPMPLSGNSWGGSYVAGAVEGDERRLAQYRVVSPDLFDTLGIRRVDGRSFEPSDPRHTAIVSRNLAERAWPGRSAIGRSLRADPWGAGLESFSVVGVVDDVRYRALREPPAETIYFDTRGWSWTDWEMDVVVRTAGLPGSFVKPIRAELARLDPEIPMAEIRTMSAYVADDLAANRFALSLIGVFAVVALTLAVVGLYGVVAYAASRRTREIGIRMALGAGRRRILRLVLAHSARLTGAGLAVGLAGSVLLTRLLGGLLYGVAPTDPWVFAGVTLLLLSAAFLATYIPARRAARLDPASTLRAE